MKRAKVKFLLSGLVLFICTISSPEVNSQGFRYSVSAAWVKMDIREHDNDFVLFPKDFSNGFEIGPLVTYRLKPAPFAFTTGLLYTAMYYESYNSYNLNFLNAPLRVSIEAGKKGGMFFGFGVRFWYLLKVPQELNYYEEQDRINRYLFSYTVHLGAFFTVKKLHFQLFPQIEYFKTALYYSSCWRNHKHENFINMVSYNLIVSF